MTHTIRYYHDDGPIETVRYTPQGDGTVRVDIISPIPQIRRSVSKVMPLEAAREDWRKRVRAGWKSEKISRRCS